MLGSLAFFAVGLAIVYFAYRNSQSNAPVALEDQVEIPDGGLTAVEYFWRPG